MTVSYFLRKPGHGFYSIERVFEDVRQDLPQSLGARVHVSRFESRGFFRRLYNMLEAALRSGQLNHVTGDVHYLTILLPKRRTVLTIHDCGTLNRLTGWRRRVLLYFWYRLPVRRAGIVTVISDFTKKELLKWVACSPAKIAVVPNPVSKAFAPTPKKFNADCPVVLQVGITPNKNIARAAQALRGISCRLRIVGLLREDDRQALEKAGVAYSCTDGLGLSGMAREYAECDFLLFASTYEGFGLPIVEAQSVGRPVVTSNVGPMPEVAGGAACLVDPFSVESIRDGVLRVIGDADYRDKLVRDGFENAKRFHPQAIAAKYAQIYESLAKFSGASCA